MFQRLWRWRKDSGTATSKGRRAEDLAVEFLIREHRYRLVERNHRNARGEIDVIAWDRSFRPWVLCFVEVKSRSSGWQGSAAEAVDHRKQERVRRAAEVYVQQLEPELPDCRFDVVTVERDSDPDSDPDSGPDSGPDGGPEGEQWRLELIRDAFE